MHVSLCDFGLARLVDQAFLDDEPDLSNEVVTKCYRPPELFLGNSVYSNKVDIWSLGCVIVELFTRKTCFSMESSKDILENIVRKVGHFSSKDLAFIEDSQAVEFIESVPRDPQGELRTLLSGTCATQEGSPI